VGLTDVLLTIHTPAYVAEQVASLDVLTEGRFVFGAGLGYRPEEFEGMGVEMKTRVSQFLSLAPPVAGRAARAGARPDRADRSRAHPKPEVGVKANARARPPVGLASKPAPAWDRPIPPLSCRLLRTLERRIRDRRYTEGERWPSEGELCREFGASRITIRQAVGRPLDLGLVTRRRGSGTVVSARQEERPPETVTFTVALEDLFAQVETVSTKSAQIPEALPPLDVRSLRGIDAGTRVIVVRRVRAFRDQIFSFEGRAQDVLEDEALGKADLG
jgi:DNA-binding transcriptional regulator YhcF (GntR family)